MDLINIHQYHGDIDQNVYYCMLSSLKPVIENFFLHASKNQEYVSDIMKTYSEYEFSLIQLQKSENIRRVKFTPHPLLERYCSSHEDWDSHVDEFKKESVTETVLKEIYNHVLGWTSEIHHILQYDIDPFESESCLTEHAFWKNKDSALRDVIHTFKSPPALLSLKLLEDSSYKTLNEKLTSIFISDKFSSVSKVYNFLNALNLMDIINARTIDDLIFTSKTILNAIEQHGVANYPIDRLFGLSALMARDLNKSILRLFPKIDRLSFDDFTHQGTIYKILSLHTDFLGFITSLTVANKRGPPKIKDLINRFYSVHNDTLQVTISRLKDILGMYDSHQFCYEMFEILKKWIDFNPFKEFPISVLDTLNNMPDLKLEWLDFLKSLDFFNFTKNGHYLWNQKVTEYKGNLSQRDKSFVECLRILLNDDISDNERIDIFIHFNNIFTKFPMIQAIHGTQNALMDKIYKYMLNEKEGIVKASNFSSKSLKNVYSLGDISFQLLNVKKMSEKYRQYLYYALSILGPNYKSMDISKKIITESSDWSRKNLASVYLKILSDKCHNLKKQRGFLFKTAADNIDSTNLIVVNYPNELIKISFEEMHAKTLGFATDSYFLPESNIEKYRCYKIIEQSLRNFTIIKNKLSSKKEIILISLYLDYTNVQIISGLSYHWDSLNIHNYARKVSECVVILNEKADIVLDISSKICSHIETLKSTEYKYEAFQNALSLIRSELANIDNFQLYNTEYYMYLVSQEVEEILYNRLASSLAEFLDIINLQSLDRDNLDSKQIFSKNALVRSGTVKYMNFDIRLENDDICVFPSLTNVRDHIYDQLNTILGVVLLQNHLLFSLVNFLEVDGFKRLYKHLMEKLNQNNYLYLIYTGIEKIISDVSSFTTVWSSFQVLWDVSFTDLLPKFNTIEKWLEFYNSFNAFKLFRTPKSYRIYPFIIIRYKLVKAHILHKYNEWTDKIFACISDLYNERVVSLLEEIKRENKITEIEDISTLSIIELTNLIADVNHQKEMVDSFDSQVKSMIATQKILEANNIPVSVTSNDLILEHENFRESHDKFKFTINSNSSILKDKVYEESRSIVEDIRALLAEWNEKKSLKESSNVDQTIALAESFESRFAKNLELIKNLSQAKKFFEIPETLEESYNLPFQLNNVIDEIDDIKQAWTFVSSIYKRIEAVGKNLFSSFDAASLNSAFEAMVSDIKKSSSIQAFDCYTVLQNRVDDLLRMNTHINQLRSDFFKERHWKSLFSRFSVDYVSSSVTLNQLWDLDFVKNYVAFNEIFGTAQGEFGLESYLSTIQDYWSACSFNFVLFKNKFEVVNNWSDIMLKLGDHINGLESMKASPYFKGFGIQVEQWQEKLTYLLNLSETWLDAQRRWIYLNGIFSDSSDLSKLLPIEFNKFASCTSDLTGLLRKISRDPFVLNIFKIPDVIGTFNKLQDFFVQIQKALSKYLEKERENFPRFYFVGDEDLLEILGNTDDIMRIQKHLKKMFPGISSLILNKDQTQIQGIQSKENERLLFKDHINLKECKNIIDWLKAVELNVSITLAFLLKDSFTDLIRLSNNPIEKSSYLEWINKYPQQLVILSEKIRWCKSVENSLRGSAKIDESITSLRSSLQEIETRLEILPNLIQSNDDPILQNKIINLITNLVYFRNKLRGFIENKVVSPNSFDWLCTLRCYFYEESMNKAPLNCCVCKIADGEFYYGFEYLGLVDYIIQTPLIDNCFLVMTQAMKMKLGGSPFGPAGTGKTESVKALGTHLGRFVIVFNCDTNFDFQAMGRIFIGLCRVGAWGCFDEFNRLEERIISAVSQQIHSIQTGLKDSETGNNTETCIELLGKRVSLNNNVAIFITMNPDYAGRSRLPNNLKRLFRSFAMTQPDRQLIAQVILYSQGLTTAEKLSSKMIPLLNLCSEQLSQQVHYDFGLRALKSILVAAGNIKRKLSSDGRDLVEFEQEIIVQSIVQSVIPKLTADDTILFLSIIEDIFPNISVKQSEFVHLLAEIKAVCDDLSLCYLTDTGELSPWLNKLLCLNEIIKVNHGIILVGDTCSGKTSCWKVLLESLHRLDGSKSCHYVIDPKAISKDVLYGSLDANTREWTDGVFTAIIRNVIENSENRNERHWIVFDGDIDPEWVENLNSTLDDNKLFTLPNGERLCLPPSVRIIFEVSDLKYATPATISRCGMIYFSSSTLSVNMIANYFVNTLQSFNPDTDSSENPFNDSFDYTIKAELTSAVKDLQHKIVSHTRDSLLSNNLLLNTIKYCTEQSSHCMEYNIIRCLQSSFLFMARSLRNIYSSNAHIKEIDDSQLQSYVQNLIIYSLIWGFSGDTTPNDRLKFCQFLTQSCNYTTKASHEYADIHVSYDQGQRNWRDLVSFSEVPISEILTSKFIVSTEETTRNTLLLSDTIFENRMVILCGPPGSGKSMTVYNISKILPTWEIMTINFSSTTTSDDLLRYLLQRCDYRKGPNNLLLSPRTGKNLLIFCDEINLSNRDKYGTQSAICLLRQLLELKGFYRRDRVWVKLEKIKFVASCNPPSYVGRTKLLNKFLRHTFILYIDYPQTEILRQIYLQINSYLNSKGPALAEQTTSVMLETYNFMKEKFTIDIQAHYVFTPRDLTLWVQGMLELLQNKSTVTDSEIVNALLYEGIGVFRDRLTDEAERECVLDKMTMLIDKEIPGSLDLSAVSSKIFNNWITGDYNLHDPKELLCFFHDKLLIGTNQSLLSYFLFNQLLETSQYISRIVERHQGHLILIGSNGTGRKTINKIVAALTDSYVFKARWHKGYSLSDFDDDLRELFKRIVTKNEKILFIIDEASALPPLLFERVTTLLSSADATDIYPAEKYISLISILKEAANQQEMSLKDNDELFEWFTNLIKSHLHFVFLFSDNLAEWPSKVSSHTTLFKRCLVKWCGTWSIKSLCEVTSQLLRKLDLSFAEYEPSQIEYICPEILKIPNLVTSVIHSMVSIHNSFSSRLKFTYASIPSTQKYILFVNEFKAILKDKYASIQEEHSHISNGLIKLEQTFSEVATMKEELSVKQKELEVKSVTASQKLSLMATEQQKAQVTREEAMKLFEEVKIQTETIHVKSKDIKLELSQVEPALEESKEALSVIDRNMLNEIRVMHTPPQLIKLAIGAVFELITGNNPDDWKAVRSFISKDDFIQTVRNFKTESITAERRQAMNKYLQNDKFTPEQISRGSITCVPLVKWVRAHIGYNDILMKIEPLRNELAGLELQREAKEKQANELQTSINELESKIEEYKIEYSVLIREIEEVKIILAQIEKKVAVSVTLLTNLEIEQKRWASTHHTFQQKKNNLIGNCLLSASFITYFGNFDKRTRDLLWETWIDILTQVKIGFDENFLRVEYLSTPDERMTWTNLGLPSENLCLENATILKYSKNFAFIIDPSGQASLFISNMYKDRKALMTSFLNPTFKKELESAVRFGNILIVKNAEFYDPILNNLIESDYKQQDSRSIVNIAGQDIDLSPSFKIFLITNDQTFKIPKILSSRMCVTNFTVTFSGLESQCLYQIFKNERPDLEAKRIELTKLQGEYSLKLYNLQKKLLLVLNEAQGGLLDDDRVVSTLQQLNQQSIEINSKVEDSNAHLVTVNTALEFYLPLATACSSIYFLLQDLYAINHLYHFSLKFFFDIFNSVFIDTSSSTSRNDQERLNVLAKCLFKKLVERTIFGFLQKDKQLFLILLAKIYLKFIPNGGLFIESIDFLLKFKSLTVSKDRFIDFSQFCPEKKIAINKLLTLKQFSTSAKKIDALSRELVSWSQKSKVDISCPVCWTEFEELDQNIFMSLNSLLLCYCLSPNESFMFFDKFLIAVFGDDLLKLFYGQLDLRKVICDEVDANTPIILLSVAGYDPSSWIDDLITDLGIRNSVFVAMGSSESCSVAEKSLVECSKQGQWLVLKNIHLASHWIKELEKRLFDSKHNPSFRLFLTAEISSTLPPSLLRSGRFLTFEPPPGVKSCMSRTFNIIPRNRFSRNPKERSRIYFILAWLHATIMERLQYSNLGWSKYYDFSEADLRVALDMVDSWIDRVAGDRVNLPPEKMPWDAMKSLISSSIYGSYMENFFDTKILKSLVEEIFTNKSFESGKILVKKNLDQVNDILVPDCTEFQDYVNWVENLPNQQNTSWLKLPKSAEYILQSTKLDQMIDNLTKVSEVSIKSLGQYDALSETLRQKTTICAEFSQYWLNILPPSLLFNKLSYDSVLEPLARFYTREFTCANSLLQTVRSDLEQLISYQNGQVKIDSHINDLIINISLAQIPKHWIKYIVSTTISLNSWMQDFATRLEHFKQLISVISSNSLQAIMKTPVIIGKFFFPEAFQTALRQLCSRKLKTALEKLELKVSIIESKDEATHDFLVYGLRILGASLTNNILQLSEELQNAAPHLKLEWMPIDDAPRHEDKSKFVNLPVYLNIGRKHTLFHVNFPISNDVDPDQFFQHGVAVIANTYAN